MSPFRPRAGQTPDRQERRYPNRNVPFVYFSRFITREDRLIDCGEHGMQEGYMFPFGQKPVRAKGHLRSLTPLKEGRRGGKFAAEGDDIYRQMQPVTADLREGDKAASVDPFGEREQNDADPVFTVREIAEDVIRDIGGMHEHDPRNSKHVEAMIAPIQERVMDRVRPYLGQEGEEKFPREFGRSKANFGQDNELTTHSDALPTAGNILADPERVFQDAVTQGHKFLYAHPFEPKIVFAAVCRHFGIKARPADAMVEVGADYVERHCGLGLGDAHFTGLGGNAMVVPLPLMAVVDPKLDHPLYISGILRQVPDMGMVRIYSDVATESILHSMRAIMRAKQLSAQMVRMFIGDPRKGGADGELMSLDEYDMHVGRIIDDLKRSYELWGLHALTPDFDQTIMNTGNNYLSVALTHFLLEITNVHMYLGLRAFFNTRGPFTNKWDWDVFLQNKGIGCLAPQLPINPHDTGLIFSRDEADHLEFMGKYPKLIPVVEGLGPKAAKEGDRAYRRMMREMGALWEELSRRQHDGQ